MIGRAVQMSRLVLYPRPAPDVLAIGESLLPTGLSLQVVDRDADPADLAAAVAGADALVGFIGPLPDQVWAAASRLRLIQLLSAGYDRIEIERARALRLPIATNGGANAVAVAEHAVMLMLAVYRRLTQLDQAVRRGVWGEPTRGAVRYHELGGKRIGLLGMGRIGREVAQRLRGFNVTLLYHDLRRLAPADEDRLGATFLSLDDLLAQADILSLHLPLLPETRGIVNQRTLARLQPGAILINTARGELVDEAALATALQTGQLGGAGLDVLGQEPPPANHPLLALDSVVVTPHTAGPTWESWPRRFANAYANVTRVLRGEPPEWVIPELQDLLK
jgi:phosphoglycerate dehydrogenase-like enzyme